MAPGGRAPGLPRGRLPGCMGGKWGKEVGGGGGGGVFDSPPPIQTKKKIKNKIYYI